ncbi:MAG: LPXTG cell wall anchor domain-containing protein, partial [Acidimicrobiia bacterium]
AISFNQPADVTNLAGVAGLPALPTGALGAGVLAAGVIDPIKVEAFQDAAGARSAVGTEVPNLDVLQGLISVKDVKVGSMSASSTSAESVGDTGVVTIGDISVLDLSAFLGGLGLGLTDLNIGTLTGLVDSLGLPVSTASLPVPLGNLGGGDISGILSQVTNLTSILNAIPVAGSCDALESLTAPLGGLSGLLDVGGLLSGLGLPLDLGSLLGGNACETAGVANTASSLTTTLTSTLNGLLPTADGLLDSVFGVLDNAPLIQLTGVEFSALAKAAETLAGSSASTTANFGTLKVGGLSVGALDLNATVAQVAGLVDTLESTLNGVLGPLGLGNLIDIGIMERTSSVKAEGAYNVADAGLNVLRVSINPPAILSDVLAPVTNLPIGNLLGGVISGLPVDTGLASGALAGAFGLTSLLSQPTTIKVGAIRAQSDFTTAAESVTATGGSPAAPPAETSGQLPRTGSNNGAWMAALAALALAGAFGITRQ